MSSRFGRLPYAVLLCVGIVAGTYAYAQSSAALYNRALSAFNAGNYDQAAPMFFELTESAPEPDIRAKSEFYLGQSFHKRRLRVAATVHYTAALKAGPAHPGYYKSIEGLVNIQRELNDQYLIPNLISAAYKQDWSALPPDALAWVHYLLGVIDQRRGKLESARHFLESVPRTSSAFPRARYLTGIVLADPHYPGGAQNSEAIRAFEDVVAAPEREADQESLRQLAMLGLGRIYYGTGQYKAAQHWYETIPRFSRYWDQALFENAFARFQDDDLGGALGSLQSLHAPQYAGAFQPESWILTATIYYFTCLYEESKVALAAFDKNYLPVADRLRPWVETGKDLAAYAAWALSSQETLPKSVELWVRGNERFAGLMQLLNQIEAEKRAISAHPEWGKLAPALNNYLEQNRQTLSQVAGQLTKNRLTEAYQTIKAFSDQGDIIRFETTKAEKELIESGVDQAVLLAKQKLFRPPMPAENWNYWPFDGEFWIDEIGYYQFTLKRGCLTKQGENPAPGFHK